MNEFDDFFNKASQPAFRKNQWGNWDYRDQNGRNPFDHSTQNMGVGGGTTYAYGPNGTVQSSTRMPTAGAYDWNVPVSQKMSDAMLEATGGRPPVMGPNGTFSAGGGPMGGGSLWDALRRDMGAMQGAEDRFQHESTGRQHDFINSVVQGGSAMGQANAAQSQMLRRQADMLDAMAGGQSHMLDPINKDMGTAADRAYRAGGGAGGTGRQVGQDVDQAVGGFQKQIGAEQQRGQEDASAAAYAQARRTESSIAQHIRENGAPSHPAEVESFIESARKMGADETQQIVAGIQSQARDRITQMNQTLATMRLQGAGLKSQAAEVDQNRTNAYLGAKEQVANNKLQQEQLSMQTRQLATQVRQMNASIWSQAVMDRVRFEAEGRANYAQMLQPESIISWVQGIVGLMGAEAAASGQNPQMK